MGDNLLQKLSKQTLYTIFDIQAEVWGITF